MTSMESDLPSRISVSSARLFDRCPRAWRYRYIERIEDLAGVPPGFRFGRAMHQALAAGYGLLRSQRLDEADGLPPPGELVRDVAVEALSEAWEAEQVPWSEGYDEAADIIAGHFTDALVAQLARKRSVVDVELRLEATLEGVDRDTGEIRPVNVLGILDLLMSDGPVLGVVDHKFGRERQVVTDRQLATYVLLTEATRGPCGFVGLNYPRRRRLDRTDIDRAVLAPTADWLVTSRARMERAYEADDFTAHPGEQCSRCEYAERCPVSAATLELT